MRVRAFRVGLVVAMLTLATAPALAGPAGLGTGVEQTQDVAPDAVVMRVALQADGDARWAVAYRIRLDDDNSTQAFEQLREDIRADEAAFTQSFADGMERTAASAENATGREMTIRNVTVETSREFLPKEYGVVTYRFEWTNFAAVDGETVRAGDAIGGLYLDSGTTLRMSWPEDYRLASSPDPQPDETKADEVAWVGPLSFDGDEPSVTVEPAPETTTDAPTTTAAAGTTPGESGGGLPLTAMLAAAVVLAVLVGGGYWLSTRDEGPDATGAATTDDGGGAAGSGATADDAASGDDGPPEDLLSNEERVLKLLEDNGGRMKQQEVADRLDWTDAKTSQVISGLHEEGDVEKFRLGRENVVTLPDQSLK